VGCCTIEEVKDKYDDDEEEEEEEEMRI